MYTTSTTKPLVKRACPKHVLKQYVLDWLNMKKKKMSKAYFVIGDV